MTPEKAPTAPYKKPRVRRRGRLRLGPIRIDLFVTGPPWWLPLDRR